MKSRHLTLSILLIIAASTAQANPSEPSIVDGDKVVIGKNAKVGFGESVAIGSDAKVESSSGTPFGSGAVAIGNKAIAGLYDTAIGNKAKATANGSVAIGSLAEATFNNTTSIGADSSATANRTTAIGKAATAKGIDSTALGVSSSATKTSSVAIGVEANASHNNSIAIGNQSKTRENDSVSFGNDNKKRTLTNIKAGTQDDDAVSVYQLNEVYKKTSVNSKNIQSNTNRINNLEIKMKSLRKDLAAQGAMASAQASLMQPYNVGKLAFTAGIGNSNNEANAIAIGAAMRIDENSAFNFNITTNDINHEVNTGIGFLIEFD